MIEKDGPSLTLPSLIPIILLPSRPLVFSIFNIAQMVPALFVPMSDYIGRRWTIIIRALGVILGTIVTATAKNCERLLNQRGTQRLITLFSEYLHRREVPPLLFRHSRDLGITASASRNSSTTS